MTEQQSPEEPTPEPKPVAPAPLTASPSSTGVVAGDPDEPDVAPDSP